MNTFTDIYVLDLHGNVKKKEHAPDGGPDGNVFDIQQGVSIGIFVKEPDKVGPGRIHHAELWGLREAKYAILAETDAAATSWADIKPNSPSYLFVPRFEELRSEYEQGWKIPDIYPVNSTGIITARDAFVIDFEPSAIRQRIQTFCDNNLDDATIKEKLSLSENYAWRVSEARKQIMAVKEWESYFAKILYRPFDVRPIYLHPSVVWRTRPEVMRHMLPGKNIALISARSNKSPHADHFFCSRFIVETKCGESTTQSYTFPLYLYPTLQEVTSGLYPANERRPNLNSTFIADAEKRLGLKFTPEGSADFATTFGPEDVFHYAYAVFHSPTYRSRYAEFMKTDFPRLPLTSNTALFKALAEKGAELVALHLMESPALNTLITRYPVSGSNTVEKVAYDETAQRVFISKTQYFEGVPPEVWEFHIGGYQVCEKWLKDRKGRKLGYDDLTHYQKVVVALKETIRLMGEVDAAIPSWPLE